MSNGTDITGGFGTQGSQVPLTTGAPLELGGTVTSGGLSSQSISTLTKSELEELEKWLFIAAFPFLQPPQTPVVFQDLSDPQAVGATGSAILSFGMKVEEMNHAIIMDMWDKYSETLKEIAKRREEDYRDKYGKDLSKEGPKSATEYTAYLMSLSQNQKIEEIGPTSDDGLNVKFGATYNEWIADPAKNGLNANNGKFPDSTFITGSLVSSPDLVSQTLGVAGAAGLQLSVSPIADAVTSLGPVSALPADSQLATALIAALLYNGAARKTENDALADASKQGQPVNTANFAINFAQNILAIVTHNVEGGQEANPEKAGQNRLIRLMLLATALAVLHRGVFKGMETQAGKDLVDLVNTNNIENADIPAEVKGMFTKLAAEVNKLLNESPETREAMLASMADYVGNNDPLQTMLKESKMLVAMLDPSVDSKRLEAKQG